MPSHATLSILVKTLNKTEYNVTLRHVRVTVVTVKKQCVLNTQYSESEFVALVIQHAPLMHHIVICDLPRFTIFVACAALPYV
jgi:hypothetical protein